MAHSVVAGQHARDRRAETQLSTEEEARKEELRRFVREKWKRIRELESQSQSSPGASSSNREEEKATTQQSNRSLPRTRSVEYDPENPFDDDKNRGQQSETRRVCASNSSSSSDRKGASGSTTAEAVAPASSLRHPKVASSAPGVRVGESRPVDRREASRSSSEKPSTKVSVRLVRPAERQKHARPVSPKKPAVAALPTPRSKVAQRNEAETSQRRRPPLKTASNERIVTKSSSDESTLRSIQPSPAVPTSRSLTDVLVPRRFDKERQEESTAPKREDEKPTRRRKRRSEVPHYQPSAVVSLSTDTSNALAELEASLARLKAHSTKASSPSARYKARSPLPSPSQDEGGSKGGSGSSSKVAAPPPRSRRSLSPAKEMRQMQLELDKGKSKGERASSSPPRVSFLQRIEQQKRAEAVLPLPSSSSSYPSPPDARTDASGAAQEDKAVRTEVKKVAKRYSYTPTQRQPEAGSSGNSNSEALGDESSCSIVIGDESIDDMVRQRKASKFLSSVRVFVDVRDQDGEDASSGWIEKLKSVGARVYSKIPSSTSSNNSSSSDKGIQGKLTHIVYKNGRPSTLHYLRSMTSNPSGPAPPIVVGVNWILESLQQGAKIEERDFLVEVGKQAIFSKPRTSMTSKRAPLSSPAHRSSPQNLAELLAKKKTIQHAPAQPSPLARRCWNMDASTSSSISAATSYNPGDG